MNSFGEEVGIDGIENLHGCNEQCTLPLGIDVCIHIKVR